MRIGGSLPDYNTMYQTRGIKENTRSDSEVITRPDGSKVLMITNQIGGMQTVTSIKLSEANPFQNDYKELSDFSDKAKAVD